MKFELVKINGITFLHIIAYIANIIGIIPYDHETKESMDYSPTFKSSSITQRIGTIILKF